MRTAADRPDLFDPEGDLEEEEEGRARRRPAIATRRHVRRGGGGYGEIDEAPRMETR
jgi:hypothetical protein